MPGNLNSGGPTAVGSTGNEQKKLGMTGSFTCLIRYAEGGDDILGGLLDHRSTHVASDLKALELFLLRLVPVLCAVAGVMQRS